MTWIRRMTSVLVLISLFIGTISEVHALPDYGYNYSFWGDAEPAPYPYLAEKHIYGTDLGIGELNTPQDVFVSGEHRMYIADTGNNRIVVLDEQGKLIRVIKDFQNNGRSDGFNKPYGLYADKNRMLYVADTQNQRIVKLDEGGRLLQVIEAPESSVLPEGFQFFPNKIYVDLAGRIYVIAQGAYEGIMEFDASGNFKGYVGTNKVRFSPVDLLWKRLSTKAQSQQMELFLPVEFSNLDVDERGFIYTVSSEVNPLTPIMRFNPSGEDILRREGYFNPVGDVGIIRIEGTEDASADLKNEGSSRFIDVVSDVSGMYSGLDSARNRIFTYDRDGNLLYQFGGVGTRSDNFQKPVAIAMLGERMVVLDQEMNRLTIFAPTRYGELIRKAVKAHYDGRADEAAAAWEEVLQLNANFDIAYIGIGKALMKKDQNYLAMEYFKHGNNRKYYSEAFKKYRKEYLWNHFGTMMTGLLIVSALIIIARVLWGRRRASAFYVDRGVIASPFHTLFRPFNGFWEMKYEQKGRTKIAVIILMLLMLIMILKQQYAGFIVNFNKPSELNSLSELSYVALPFLLFCIANWSLTTLMDGEGKFRDIVMATGYSLLPLIIVYIPQILFSNIMTLEESTFYYLMDTIAVIWFLWLLFVGMMTVHQYSIYKTILTLFLTVIVMFFIVFLGILCFSLLQQMIAFAQSIFIEIWARL